MSQQSVMTPQKAAAKIPSYAWAILFATYLATVSAPLNQMKVPPLLTTLKSSFQLTDARAGDLMAIFSIMGFVLAIPAGFILRRFGIKITGLIAIGAMAIGAALGAFFGTAEMLFIGRFVEGIGMGLIMVAGPSAISLWFPAEKRGLPMGIWASSVGVGTVGALNLAPALAQSHDWRFVWWCGAGLAAVAFVLFGILFRNPRKGEIDEPAPQPGADREKPISMGKALSNPALWMLCIAFGCFNLVVLAWSNFYPNFLETVRGYSAVDAAFVTSLMMMVAIFSGPGGGYLSDRLGSRKIMIIVPFLLTAISFVLPFSVTGWMIPAFMIYSGIVIGPVAAVLLAAVPETMKSTPQLIGIGLGIVAMGQNLGMYIGPSLFGRLIEMTGYATAGYFMIPICAVAIICTWMAKIR